MKLMRSAVLMLALVAAVGACDDEDDDDNGTGPGVTIADIAGSYDVQVFEYEEDDSGSSFDLAGVGMGLTDITIQSDGDFSGELVFPNQQGTPTPYDIGGTIDLVGTNGLTINFDAATQALGILDASETGTFSWDGDDEIITLILTEVTVPENVPGMTADADADLTIRGSRI